MRYRGMNPDQRPDAATLAFAEGFCRALAATSEAEYDAGRWEKTVATADGPAAFTLSIPHLLQGGPFAEPTAAEGDAAARRARATVLCEASQEQPSRRELQMLRQALRLDPDCADAYFLLARRESDAARAEPLYRRAVEAARRSLGDDAFNVPGFPFWLAVESRPFMRAMAGLAGSLDLQGRHDDSIDVLAEMLRLNPGDNQGVRYRYLTLLLMTGRLDDARRLLESPDYRDDACAVWDYATALVAFKQGRRADADAALARAVSRNELAVELLLDPSLIPPGPIPGWTPGDASEAVVVADLLAEPWGSDAKALRWLDEATAAPRPKPGKSAKRTPRK
jgi:tetratricopeptide (TPR) repeat protein